MLQFNNELPSSPLRTGFSLKKFEIKKPAGKAGFLKVVPLGLEPRTT